MNTIKNRTEWNSLLKGEFSEYNDIYFRYEYFELYKRHYDVEPEGIFWEDGNVKIFWTHLIRDISKIEQFKDFKYYDLTTPYGYGGPLIITKGGDKEKVDESLKEFFEEYKKYALKNNYVCEFIRFYPIFENWKFFNRIFDVEYLNDVVIVDLTKDLEEIWKGIRKGHKYNIKKSIREGCKVEVISNPPKKDIDSFIKIYYHAMDKNKASKKYYFSIEFITDHFNLLKSILIEVKYNNRIIGTSMLILGGKIIHYHLSGAAYGLKSLYPSDLILWEAIKWAKENNFKLLHLGGGRAKNDSLFKFKKGFSNDIIPFYIGKKIFDIKAYQALLTMNPLSTTSNNYFPAYRPGLDEKIV
ncbi:MAG TPA: GNAT family N-acetyltransferase [Methanophagales archaeon]|nr:GNAT family N-acetyltransferase [Methanophagales archaeon]